MGKKWLILIIAVLLGVNVFMLFHFQQLRQRYNFVLQEFVINSELHSLKVSFSASIENSNFKLEDVSVRDSLGNTLLLSDILSNKPKYVLVCRFSELHCESCIYFAVQFIRHSVDLIGAENIVLLGSYRNNRVFSRTMYSYGVHNLNFYNVGALTLPAERDRYPYYFILNRDLTVSNVFFPDRTTPSTTERYLRAINRRFFENR